jgi:hypothetical protein
LVATITAYSNGTQAGYQITNLTTRNSETLHLGNNTKTINITINFITPTGAGITANNKAYNLTVGSPVALMDPNNYTYHAELTAISYLPILHTITLLVYGQPNNQSVAPPITIPAANTTTIVPKQATITIPANAPPIMATAYAVQSFVNATPPILALVLMVVMVIIICLVYLYYNSITRDNRK